MVRAHGALARAGKNRGMSPKVEPTEKKKKPKGRAGKRLDYNRKFMNGPAPQNRIYPLPDGFTDTSLNLVVQCPARPQGYNFLKLENTIMIVKEVWKKRNFSHYIDGRRSHYQDNAKKEERRQERRLMIKDRMQFMLSTLEDGDIISLLSFGTEDVLKIPKSIVGTWNLERSVKRLPHIPPEFKVERTNCELFFCLWKNARLTNWDNVTRRKETLQLAGAVCA